MPNDTPDPLYYLRNFERALGWLAERYADLLTDAEHAFLTGFACLPEVSRALLTRMLMRKGALFRTSRLAYREIGCPLAAAEPLVAAGWVDADAPLTLDALFDLSTRAELLALFPAHLAGAKAARKHEWLDLLRGMHADAQPYAAWHPHADERVLHVSVAPLCERFRLMFFGNLHQDWSEFVLAELGVYQYEPVAFEPSSRAFQQRADVDIYLALYACSECVETLDASGNGDAAFDTLLHAVETIATDNPWLATRRAKLLYRIGYHAERRRQWDTATAVYQRCTWPGARHRRVRALELAGRADEALTLALQALREPESEEESQRVARMLPRLQRLHRQAGGDSSRLSPPAGRVSRSNASASAREIERSVLTLERPAQPPPVEYVVLDHLSEPDAPVHYVENGLINSLFGLLCWQAVFAALPGAFFHPFQRGPADLHAPDFYAKRAALFNQCLAELDGPAYRATILRHFDSKAGRQSPFVFWNMLSRELLDLALDCIPALHLKRFCERLLRDIRVNRSGLPDLVRFWPRERRYELIEVKGPGDRLQDNQIRWLDYCVQHGMPVRVVDVRWADGDAEADHSTAERSANESGDAHTTEAAA
ncbi:VRR-NUC domain-containing protein [Paraburkholderia rhizosphaerae]|uniref:phosphodiesterase I n=1 Tax=Paraburkholderia rhizosphaerae TaxID=480658 RepID=A0A4R8L508_9BURK|nr:VRR-NUC domain-containing protein [Paraburkholderia rhizosphaerae]TDY37049.1 VRR-NUC domain-containing protein [Paraburkholderia rhizosphaerae]